MAQPVLPWWEPPDPARHEPPEHDQRDHPGGFAGCLLWPCDAAHRRMSQLAERKHWAYQDFVRRWSIGIDC